MDTKNKVAIVTGGIRGIGLAIVQHLLRSGVKYVAIFDVQKSDSEAVVSNLEKLKREFGDGKFGYYHCDVTNSNEFNASYERVSEVHGYVDILVNNAGIINERDIDLMVDINFKAVVKCTLTAIEHMKKEKNRKGGVIVNIGSNFGLVNTPYLPVYAATKHAVVSFVRSMKEHNKTLGVRILCLCPGLTKTDLVDVNHLRESKLDFVELEKHDRYAQGADNAAAAVIGIIQRGEDGAVWLSHNDEPAFAVKDVKSVEELKKAF